MKKSFLWVIGGFALFLFFFILRFPYRNLQGTISEMLQKRAGILMVSKDVSPALLGWPGISFEEVDASVPAGSDTLNVKAQDVTIRVGIAGLFPFGPSVSAYLRGLEKGGEAYVKFKDRKTAYGVSFDAADVDLSQFAAPGSPAVRGKLFSDISVNYNTLELNQSYGDVDLSIDDVIAPPQNIPGGYLSTPELKLGKLVAKLKVEGGVAKLDELRFGGGNSDITGSITGQIRLGRTYQDSTLDIVLKIQASETFAQNPESKSLLSYLSAYKCTVAPNAFGLKWNKAIGDMMRNTFDAFPTKTPC